MNEQQHTVNVFNMSECSRLREGGIIHFISQADLDHAVALERERIAAWLEGHATCGNCDGRLCMGCVFREYDHTCAEDCPDCCEHGQEIQPGVRLAARLRNGDHWKDGA